MKDLMENLGKIHTNPLGIVRIKKNLQLETDDVVNWCKRKKKCRKYCTEWKKLVCICW